MTEYISREVALIEIGDAEDTVYAERRVWAIPAADVVEVRHGRWLPGDIPDSILGKCSECGFDTGAFTYRYCPNCGAKMKGGQDE